MNSFFSWGSLMENKERLLSLDIFRGITIMGMILVNNPGSWKSVYSPLLHAEWNGCTPTDLIFPFFLFIVGVTTTYSLSKYRENTSEKKNIYLKILFRSFNLFALGLLLALIPKFDFTTLRIPGVLQRIAIVYFFISIIFLNVKRKNIVYVILALLSGYWILFLLTNSTGSFDSALFKTDNIAALFDRFLLEGHLYRGGKMGDPEGILSTIPALATGLTGLLTGYLLKDKNYDRNVKTVKMFFYGTLLAGAGYVFDFWFPINKHLWTSSYVVYTSGLALIFLAVCYWIVDVNKNIKWAKPFHIFGLNAIFVFFFSGILAKILYSIKLSGIDGKTVSLQSYLFKNVYLSFFEPVNASLLYAITNVLFWLFISWLLYRKKIFIKI